jgi:glycosyltransferase involved in cell wall biosynthesis
VESDPLSICMYTPTASGGHARYTYAVLSALSEVGKNEGVRVSLVTSHDLDPQYRTSLYPIHGVLPPLVPRSEYSNPLYWFLSRMIHYIRRDKIYLRWLKDCKSCDGIHFQEYQAWYQAPWHFRVLKARGLSLFFTVHHLGTHRFLPNVLQALYPRYLRDYFHRAAFKRCDALFVHTEGVRQELVELLGKERPPIFITPHGVWDSADDADTVVNLRERAQRRRLLFFGRLHPDKGLTVLLRAMGRLPDCNLTIAGPPTDPGHHKEIRNLIEQLPAGQIKLIDRFVEDDEMGRLFEQSSLVVLPYTHSPGQSGILLDALAHRLPVVVNEVGVLGESVRRWGIGELVPPNDDAALADAVREMLTLDRYTQASGMVDRVRTDFSWNRAAEITIEAYHSVMRDRSKATTR